MNKLIPFDLEKAKNGHPVQTRDGSKVRIICFDAKNKAFNDFQPIIALIEVKDDIEILVEYYADGSYYEDKEMNNLDLFMVSKKISLKLYKSFYDGSYGASDVSYTPDSTSHEFIKTIEVEIEE